MSLPFNHDRQYKFECLLSETFFSLVLSGLPYKMAQKLADDTTKLYFDDSIQDNEKEDCLQAYLSFLSLGAPPESAYNFAKGTLNLFEDIKSFKDE